MNPNLAAVLDLGSTKVTCLIASNEGSRRTKVLALKHQSWDCIKKGVIVDHAAATEAIRQVVSEAAQVADAEVTELVVSISGAHLEGLTGRGMKPIVPRSRQITHQDVLEVVNHSRSMILASDRELIQAIPREFKVDGVRDVHRPIGQTGGRLEVTTFLVSAQSSIIQGVERAIQGAGYAVEQMIFSGLASAMGVCKEGDFVSGVAVIDLGGDSTDVAILVNGSIAYAATVPVGSNSITSDVAQLLQTIPEEAERLKLRYGTAEPERVSEQEIVDVVQLGHDDARPLLRRVLAEIIESRVREIATLCCQHIDKSGFGQVLSGGIVLTGKGSKLPGVDKPFDQVAKHLRVRVAHPEGFGSNIDAGDATAIGLAVYALQCYEELSPATGANGWRERVKSLFTILKN